MGDDAEKSETLPPRGHLDRAAPSHVSVARDFATGETAEHPTRMDSDETLNEKEKDGGDAASRKGLEDSPNHSSSASSDTLSPDTGRAAGRPTALEALAMTPSLALTPSVRAGLAPLKKRETRLAQKKAHPIEHLGITLGLPMILLCDVVIPMAIYYQWFNRQRRHWVADCNAQFPGQNPCPLAKPEFDEDITGGAIGSFGVGELWILIARVWRLFYRREECAPLLSRSRWELDATSWVYGVAMIVALIPFVVGSACEVPELYLYAPSCLMAFLGALMVITIYPIPLPIGINSQPRGSRLRPFIYYAAEDFIAVDGLQDREFRIRYNERYETNKRFRRFFVYLTLWWILGVCIYIGIASAVIWTLEFHYAFGLVIGLLFVYILIWAVVTYFWVQWEMKQEHLEYEAGKVEG